MQKFFGIFVDSAKEFKNLKSVIMAALLVALHTVFAMFLSIQVTDSLRISVSFIANVAAGCLFGPVMGFVCGGIGDIIQFILKPTGPYFPGWTLSAALAGFIYGVFLYKKFPQKAKKATDDTGNFSQLEKLYMTAKIVISVCVFVFLMAAPYVTVRDKSSKEIIVTGSAFDIVKNGFTGPGRNSALVGIILIAVSVAMVVFAVFKINAVALMVTVFGCFASALAIYTDKKTTTAGWGFYVAVILIIIYMGICIKNMADKHALDLGFLARVTLVLTFDTMLVNVLIGTYWVSVMYGKGFAFYFITRFIKNIIQLPINIILTYYVLGFIKTINDRLR